MVAFLIGQAAFALGELRMWTDAETGRTVQASLLSVDGDEVVLKRSDNGKTFRIPIARLSAADQRYITSQTTIETTPPVMPSTPAPGGAAPSSPSTPAADDEDLPTTADLTAGTPLEGLTWNPVLAIVMGVLNIPLIFLWGKMFFTDWAGFREALGYLITPDWISFWRGEGVDDWWATMKFNIFMVWCAATVIAQYILIQKIF
jgi:hypothetical protein